MSEIRTYRTRGAENVPGAPMPHIDDGSGYWRALGVLPPRPDFGGFPRLAEGYSVIPRDRWETISFAGYDVPILDQDGHGSCVGHGSATAHWKAWLMSGQSPHEFSPTFVYALGNGGRDAGMIISDALEILTQKGNCLASQFPEGKIWRNQIPSEAFETAKRFRVAEAYHATSFDEIATGLLMSFIPVYGIYVGGDFNNLDQEGVPPAYNSIGNHCLTADGLRKLPSGRWSIDCINSWGTRWGRNGRCQLVEQHFRRGDSDAFLIKVVAEDPEEKNVPPRAE